MGVREFLYEHFVLPLEEGSGYNIYNTLTYGILLILGSYGVLRLLRRLGVRMDEGLLRALVPYVVLGGILRALEEFARISGAGLVPHTFLLLTPGIYLLVTLLVLAVLVPAAMLRDGDYHGPLRLAGTGMCALAGLLYLHDLYLVASGQAVSGFSGEPLRLQLEVFGGILLLSGAFALALLHPLRRLGMHSEVNLLIVWGAAFDAASVSLAHLAGYTAEQPLTQLMLTAHPLLYPLFKLGLYLLILYFVERDVPAAEEAHWLTKLILLVLSLPMGIHNSLQVLLGL
ncbi:MAG: DUF63 family protein [Euryarchaeota archaeon]|nr:DUF63 family protein [Euryarchaeota archaeon]